MKRLAVLGAVCAFASVVLAEAYEIGEAMAEEAFWKSDPVLFVKKHEANGFMFTTDQREGADSRLEGGVAYYGVPVYETRVAFGAAGGIERVEVMLYNAGGTEQRVETPVAGGKLISHVRVDKTIEHAAFGEILKTVREHLTASGAKEPKAVSERRKGQAALQFVQSWPKTDLPTRATLTWNYRQQGKKTETFKAGFIRVVVEGPAALAGKPSGKGAKVVQAASGGKKIADNVVRDPRGDVFIDNVPMVDQGRKGYCAAASAERVLKYFGLGVDEHEIAEAAGTTAEGGTSVRAMKDSIESIGKRYKLATVVAYGDFAENAAKRIDGLEGEVKAYNKMAKKMKKPVIAEDVYVRHEGNVTLFDPGAVDRAMDPEVRKEMRVNGMLKSKYTRFLADLHQQVDKGIPLFWGLQLGIYPEPGIPQAGGGHMRLIIGYNDKRKEILYTDSWGAGHELKRMPADWAFSVSDCLMYLKPLSK